MNLLNTLFLICSTGFFLYIAIIWRRSNVHNVVIKIYLFLSSIAGIILILHKCGYLIKI